MTNREQTLRYLLAGVYALGAIVHVYFLLVVPEIYEAFADLALLSLYQTFWTGYIVPNLSVLIPIVILFELSVAIALLGNDSISAFGNFAGAAFQFGLVLSGPWGLINLGLAILHLFLSGPTETRPDISFPSNRRSDPPKNT